jgi:O-antigen/teichoic acid export membrane protein
MGPLAALRARLSTLTAFDAGRGGRARLAVATGVVARAWLVLVTLASIPITIGYLGNEGYALFLAMTSVVTWLQFTNLGIGAGLQNAMTEAVARNDAKAQQTLVSTAVVALAAITIGVLAALAAAFPFVNWARVFPATDARYLGELRNAMALTLVCFCVAMSLGFVPALLNARQESHIAYLLQIISGTAALVMVFAASRFNWGLTGIIAGTLGTSCLVSAATAIWLLFMRRIPQIRPSLAGFSPSVARRLMNRSSSFFVLTLTSAAFYQSDIFILTHMQSAEEAAPFGVAQRAYAQFGSLFAIVTGSLWVAYGHARAQGDAEWIERTYRRSRRVQALAFGFILLVMLSVGEYLLRIWVGSPAAPHFGLIAVLGVLFVVQQWTATHAQMLNGLDVVRPQVACLVINGIALLALSAIGARVMGPVGLAIGGILAYSLTSVWYLPYLVKRTIRKLREGKHR